MNDYYNHTCIICGKAYRACPACSRIHSFQPWRTITDTRNCYKIFLILNSHAKGYISRTEAKEQLNACHLPPLDSFVPHIREAVQAILEREDEIL